jgi:hypothetical protein
MMAGTGQLVCCDLHVSTAEQLRVGVLAVGVLQPQHTLA